MDNNSSKVSEEKLQEAREKLACHILPPSERPLPHETEGDTASSCGSSGSSCDFIDPSGRIRLTQMTSAGG